ncbi:MAG: hypothetical protein DWQ05_09490 [Calditrichaeota bacterium]|nr:MAG: hypothetical protein DWQ05_09490 [Calditrichota bacterium]
MSNRLLLPYLFLIFSSQVFAGVWNRQPGSIYLKLSTSYISTSNEFNHLGQERSLFFPLKDTYPDASFTDRYTSIYFEYGLHPKLTVVSQLAFKSMTAIRKEISGGGLIQNNVESQSFGFSDLDLAIKYGLHSSRLTFAVESAIKLPLNYENDPTIDAPPLGTGEVDFTEKLLIGKGFHPGYFSAGIGYRFRGGNRFNDQIIWDAESGFTLGKSFLKIFVEGTQSTKTPPDIYGSRRVSTVGGALPSSLTGDQDIFKIAPSLTYKISPDMGISFEVIHILAGKNTISGTSFAVGLAMER